MERLASLSPQLRALQAPLLTLVIFLTVRGVTVAVFQGSPRVARQSASNQARQVGPRAGAAKVSRTSEGFFLPRQGSSVLLPAASLKVASTESASRGWDCRQALWSGKLRASDFPSTQVTSLPG